MAALSGAARGLRGQVARSGEIAASAQPVSHTRRRIVLQVRERS
jgi:hypothetical protein